MPIFSNLHKYSDSWCHVLSCSVVSDCKPMDCNLPGISVHGDSPGKNTRVVVMPSRGSSQPRDGTQVSRIADGFFTVWASRKTLSCSYLWFLKLWYITCNCWENISKLLSVMLDITWYWTEKVIILSFK